MIIVFDLRALQIGHQNRGIGMYIKSVLENLPKDDNQYIFYAFDEYDPVKELNIKFNNSFQLVQTPVLKSTLEKPADTWNFIKLIEHRFRKLKPYKPDVFVQFDFGLGMPKWRGIKKIVIAYDLIPLIKQNEYMPSARFAWQHSAGFKNRLRAVMRSIYYRFKYRLSYKVYKRSDAIVSISESTTKTFVELLGVSKKQLHTIPLAPVLSREESDSNIAKDINKPYIFYIGGTDSRKRIEDVIHAFNIARGRGMDLALVFAGSEFREVENLPDVYARKAIMTSSYKSDIHLVGFVSNSEKIALYRQAHAFIFCSTYEGFGLPVVESMAESCPVISYSNSSIPEAAGNAALLVETGDYVAVARAILSLQDKELRQEMIKEGLDQAKKFNWGGYVKEFAKVLQAN